VIAQETVTLKKIPGKEKPEAGQKTQFKQYYLPSFAFLS